MNNLEKQRYEKAKERVDKEKGFYSHLTTYIIINIVIIIINTNFNFSGFDHSDLGDWVSWNVLATPILWGIGLLFHGISVFGKIPSFGKQWEERKIKELMDKDKDEF